MTIAKQEFSLNVSKPITIGIIGGGQLGKMIAQEAKRMSLNVAIIDPSKDCPAASIVDEHIVADFADEQAIIELARISDILTYEIELANADVLSMLERQGYKVAPSSYTLKIIQDKLEQRRVLRANNIPVPEFIAINDEHDLMKALRDLGYPAMLKARRGSYDGRGNLLIRSKDDIDKAKRFIASKGSFLEQFIEFDKEVAVMVARNDNNQIVTYPLVENIHEDNILHLTIVPARVDDAIKERARKVAEDTMRVLEGSGIFGIEMFVYNDDILINEIAPRPHNSGHYSIEACDISQFEMHIRAILNLPLVKPRLLSPAVMINILGDASYDDYSIYGLESLLSLPSTRVHIYGKKGSRVKRKLGHITVLDDDIDKAIDKAKRARGMIRIGA